MRTIQTIILLAISFSVVAETTNTSPKPVNEIIVDNLNVNQLLQDVSSKIKTVDTQSTELEALKAKMEELKSKNKELEELTEKVKEAGEDVGVTTTNGATFGEFGFGIGFGIVYLDKPDITQAVVDNGKVIVTGEEYEKLGIWLTTSWVHDRRPSRSVNFGPYLGVQLGSNDQIVNSISIGLDFSFKKPPPEFPLDFQFGWAWTRTKTLADGYAENGDVPEGSSQVITRDIISHGPIVLVSYNF